MLAPVLSGGLLLLAALALLIVGLLGWRGRLPRNSVAGVRTPAALRTEATFRAANRVAAPSLAAAGVVCLLGGGLAFGAAGGALVVIAGVSAIGTLVLVTAGGVLGDRAAGALSGGRACWAGCGSCGSAQLCEGSAG